MVATTRQAMQPSRLAVSRGIGQPNITIFSQAQTQLAIQHRPAAGLAGPPPGGLLALPPIPPIQAQAAPPPIQDAAAAAEPRAAAAEAPGLAAPLAAAASMEDVAARVEDARPAAQQPAVAQAPTAAPVPTADAAGAKAAAPNSSGATVGTWDTTDRSEIPSLVNLMEAELGSVLKRRKIPTKMKRPAAFKEAEVGEDEGADVGPPSQEVDEAAEEDMVSENSDEQPLVSKGTDYAQKKPAAATLLGPAESRNDASMMKKPAAAKAENQGGNSTMSRPAAAKPPGVESQEGEAATRRLQTPPKLAATPTKPTTAATSLQGSRTPKASTTAVAAQSGAKQAANFSKIGELPKAKEGAKKRPAAAVSPATHRAFKLKRSNASEELGADSSDVDIDVSKLGLKHPELQWPGVPKTPRPVFQVNGWNVWTDLKGAKWRVRAIEWTNPSDFGFGFGQKEPVLAKLAWGRLLNKVSRAPSA